MKRLSVLAFSLISLVAQDHGHLNIGASSGKLTFDNGADFSGAYVKTLIFTNAGKYANFYQGNITFTALHSTNAFGEIDPAAPGLGAFVVAAVVSVEGPAGGEFAFWDSTGVTASFQTGTTNGTFRFNVSDADLGAGQPAGDAFGHIHGRRFTATKPGIYTVGFRVHDISANGPRYAPSDVQFLTFQAGVNMVAIHPASGMLTFGAAAGYSWQLEATSDLVTWIPIGGPLTGNDTLLDIEDAAPPGQIRFYRVVGTPTEF
jgi:hypothetical protein